MAGLRTRTSCAWERYGAAPARRWPRVTGRRRGDAGSVLDTVHDEGTRCVVINLGSLPARDEQSLIPAAVLGDLWRRRHERKPVLISAEGGADVPAAWAHPG
jgi:hypothetical protein